MGYNKWDVMAESSARSVRTTRDGIETLRKLLASRLERVEEEADIAVLRIIAVKSLEHADDMLRTFRNQLNNHARAFDMIANDGKHAIPETPGEPDF